ncbi:MAG: uncharacterized protein PWP23_2821 [Candidatus Sumerlaeota bacterium]|nr:uncharacterized protein [Candidatus Sumerlaeota bacterium]
MTTHRFGLISDTHGHLHPGVFDLFEGVEAIFHAGDVVGEDILDELEVLAPVHAVAGNCDPPSPRLPGLREIQAPFGKVLVTHSHLVSIRYPPGPGLAAHFAPQRARLIVYGHTHQAYKACHDGTWVVNPGPAGRPRFREVPSVVVLTWESDSDKLTFRSHKLDWTLPRRS